VPNVRVGLLAHDLTDPAIRGLQRYTAGLAAALARVADLDLFLLSRQPTLPMYDHIAAERISWPGTRESLWEQCDLPAVVRRASIDILHAPSNRGLPLRPGCATVLTRHDEIEWLRKPDFPQTRKGALRIRYSDWISMRVADAVITVSDVSRGDISTIWPGAARRVCCLGEGIDDSFFREQAPAERDAVLRHLGVTGQYVLYVGGYERRKDVHTLIDAFARLSVPNLTLALAGDQRGIATVVHQALAYAGPSAAIRLLGRVSDEQLHALYAGACCFVYPSLYEGFGLQAVEAMACGTPVIASDGGSLPEIVGSAGVVFRAGDADALAERLYRVLTDRDLRERLVRTGITRANDFRWATVVERYTNLYEGLRYATPQTGRRHNAQSPPQ
jgi:glycosyltransferase involved in cell wall biosynthesis